MVIKLKENYGINNLFTKKRIEELLILNREESQKRVNDLLRYYKYLEKEHRNEFYYKNMLFNKYVLGRFSVNTSIALSEIEIGFSKADFAIINKNNSMVIEIKTELDNLERLPYQLNDYYKAFSEVYVMTSESNFYPVYKMIKDSDIGILVLTSQNNISLRKLANRNVKNLSHQELFRLLRKNEYEEMIKEEFEKIPNIPATKRYKEYFKMFKTKDVIKCQKNVFTCILGRKRREDVEYIKQVPFEFRWLVYQSKLNKKNYERLLSIFEGGI